MATAKEQAKLQTFNTAYPFDFKLKNNFGDEGLSILYIVNKVNASKSTQSITLEINQCDNNSYSLRSFQSSTDGTSFDKMPNQNQYNFAFGFRNGVLRKPVLQSFQQNLQNAINTTLTDQNNTCIVSPPVPDPINGTLFFYVAFKNNLSIAPDEKGLWSMNIELEAISAEPGAGSRATQIEFKCSNLYLNNSGEGLTFERQTHVDIINHQGSGYAPLHFGVLGSGDLLINTPSPLTLYFENIDEKNIDFDDQTKIVFDFTYGDNHVNSFGINKDSDKSGSNITSISLNYSYLNTKKQPIKKTSSPDSSNEGVVEVVASDWNAGTIPNPVIPDLQTELNTQQGFIKTSADYFAGITSLNDEARTYITNNIQPLIDLDGKRNDCLNLIKSVNLNYSAYGKGININNPFTIDTWNEAFSTTSQHNITLDTINQTVLENSPFNSPTKWAPDFLEYVTDNFNPLITKLDSYSKANGYDQLISQINYPIVDRSGNTNSWTTHYEVYPSAALYDYFQIEFQKKQNLERLGLIWETDNPVDLYNTVFINTASPFTTNQWNNTFRFANKHFNNTSELIQSATGVASSFDPLLAWQNKDFTDFTLANFSSLIKKIKGLKYLTLNGNNYLIPCQSLYDYLWFNFKEEQTTSTLNNKKETPDTVPVYLSTEKLEFNFTDVQVTGNPGKVFVRVTVEDLPGYFNTTFHIPVNKVNYQLNNDLILPTGRIGIKKTGTFGGNIKTYGSTLTKGNSLTIGSSKIGGYLKVYSYTEIAKDLVVHGNAILDGNMGIGTSKPTEKLEVNGRIKDQTGYVMPVGSIIAYGGSTVPEGWLRCEGQDITNDPAKSPNLYAQLRTTIGADSAKKYVIPDLRSRFILGANLSPNKPLEQGLTSKKINAKKGDEEITLTALQMPQHNHTLYNDKSGKNAFLTAWYDGGNPDNTRPGLISGGNEYGTITATKFTTEQGGNQPHNNMPPYWALTYIIKY